jgi:Protein of unknown function, DUF481
MKMRFVPVPLSMFAIWLVFAAPACADSREKVDVITLFNGDRLTGEIKSLEYGRLALETDYMGTVQIEWPDIVRIESPQDFQVEDAEGSLLYGHIVADPEAGYLAVADGSSATRRVELTQVARLSQSETRLLDRLHGSFSLGFDYAKSSDITTLSGSFNTNYRGPTSSWSLGIDVNSTHDPAQGTIDRDSIQYGYRWLRSGRHFWAGVTSIERNEETGIEARLLVGGGFGSYFFRTPQNEVAAVAGIAASREWATGAANSQNSLEGILAVDWRIFDFAAPKTNLAASAVLFPSLTESGRYRTDAKISLRREIVSDFYLDLSLFHAYDTDPPDVAAEKSDYGVITSLGYSF